MGARGRIPMSQQELALRGSRRAKHRPPADDAVTRPTCPKNLHGEAKAAWTRAIADLAAMGTLRRYDRAILVSWAVTCSDIETTRVKRDALPEADPARPYLDRLL